MEGFLELRCHHSATRASEFNQGHDKAQYRAAGRSFERGTDKRPEAPFAGVIERCDCCTAKRFVHTISNIATRTVDPCLNRRGMNAFKTPSDQILSLAL